MPQTKAEEDVICFNYFREEELINIKFRGRRKIFKLATNAELIFYHLDGIKDKSECVITEGEIDAMSFYEAGVHNVTSVPNGAAVGSNQQLIYLDNCIEYFAKMKKIVLATDDDMAGRNLRSELARRLGKERCYQVTYPIGSKDANEVLVKYGSQALKEVYENATVWPLEGIRTLNDSDIKKTVLDWYENGYPKGLRTHIPGFDELLQFWPGQLTLCTGVPQSGKSEFLNYISNISDEVSRRNMVRVFLRRT
jgi:twinkle protein